MSMAFVGKWRLSVDYKKAPPLGRLMTKWRFLEKDGAQVCLDAFLYPTEGGRIESRVSWGGPSGPWCL